MDVLGFYNVTKPHRVPVSQQEVRADSLLRPLPRSSLCCDVILLFLCSLSWNLLLTSLVVSTISVISHCWLSKAATFPSVFCRFVQKLIEYSLPSKQVPRRCHNCDASLRGFITCPFPHCGSQSISSLAGEENGKVSICCLRVSWETSCCRPMGRWKTWISSCVVTWHLLVLRDLSLSNQCNTRTKTMFSHSSHLSELASWRIMRDPFGN